MMARVAARYAALAAAVVMLPPGLTDGGRFRNATGTRFVASGLENKDPESICRATFQHLRRLSYIFLRISA